VHHEQLTFTHSDNRNKHENANDNIGNQLKFFSRSHNKPTTDGHPAEHTEHGDPNHNLDP